MAYTERSSKRKEWIEIARKFANFLLEKMVTPSGKVFHRYADGEVKLEENLDDYVYLLCVF